MGCGPSSAKVADVYTLVDSGKKVEACKEIRKNIAELEKQIAFITLQETINENPGNEK